MSNKSLYDIIADPYAHQQRKHELGEDRSPENEINRMTNEELLRAISDALEEMKGEGA